MIKSTISGATIIVSSIKEGVSIPNRKLIAMQGVKLLAIGGLKIISLKS